MTDLDLPADDDFEALIAAPKSFAGVSAELVPVQPVYSQNCFKCRGTGQFIGYSGRSVGSCFACKGTGKMTYKTSPEQRANGRANAASRKQRDVEAFKAEHPEVWAWMDGSDFEFAVSLRDALYKYGSLTQNQLAAAQRAAEKLKAAKAASAERAANAEPVDISKLDAAFAKARANGITEKLKLRFAGYSIAPAKAHSKNFGALYVKAGQTYLGKIADGKFFASRDCTADLEQGFRALCADPLAAAVTYGMTEKRCSCCGLKLTNPESRALGIGPICRAKWF